MKMAVVVRALSIYKHSYGAEMLGLSCAIILKRVYNISRYIESSLFLLYPYLHVVLYHYMRILYYYNQFTMQEMFHLLAF